MPEDKITLDKEVFKTLASGTRVDILKSLDRRRKTLTELSKQFGMSVSTVKEHLDNLVSVGLIEQKDEGYKWKYYELTGKGKNILHPEDKKIWILLSISALAMIGIGYDLMRNIYRPILVMGGEFAYAPQAAITEGAERGTDLVSGVIPQFPYLHVLGLIIFGIVLGVSLGHIITGRRRVRYRV
ncbi:MAG: helix-turn-helix domain-containing protein [Candidatus Aenigmarchaeota archaeon]|nr:helix-turn-helix domain-containing protein [Candidatus Aenigmarchaeota archaeon]NIP40077.1 helix-turn-helix domain-containing protein [Candidatus Aenigmarchaeota archaeon]NIQ18154.1 helix-turn-helix domain-containing protein [Candidatus Aenigmarchaeota archaeon]NIS72911.1 helix-turn-helix domain-containing protein [Candidatus Aenigmarchaeota archaeon]